MTHPSDAAIVITLPPLSAYREATWGEVLRYHLPDFLLIAWAGALLGTVAARLVL